MVNIFIGNLAFSVRVEHLRALFEQFGKVDRTHIPFDRQTRRSRGFAFVEMPDRPAAEQAIAALQGTQLDGRPILVREADDRPTTTAPTSDAPTPPAADPPTRSGYTNTRRGVTSQSPRAGC